jgi:hypothetical protein
MKKPVKILLIILGALIVIVGAFVVFVIIDSGRLQDVSYLEPGLKTVSPQEVHVDGVKLISQPDPYTCGETTICVIDSFCQSKDISPKTLIDKYTLTGGMSTDKFAQVLSAELPDYTVTYRHNLDDMALLQGIHDQLGRGLPVPVFFGAANPYNKPYYDFHASVVTGLDLEKQQVSILNVYGYEEQITLTDFFNRMGYRGTGDYPFVQKAVIKLGLMEKNSFVSLEKK